MRIRTLAGFSLLIIASTVLFLRSGLIKPSQHQGTPHASQTRHPALAAGAPSLAPSTVDTLPPSTVPTSPPTLEADPISAFAEWTERYLKAAPKDRFVLEAEGRQLAMQRRAPFRELIRSDPRLALENATPIVVRQRLPASILSLLEERLNGVAALRVLQGVPPEGESLPTGSMTFREAEFREGKTYRAYVYGQREAKLTWTAGASLNGVAMDADFAVNENPSRTLEVGELPPEDKSAVTICPVSGNKTPGSELEEGEPITADTPAVETATEVVHFCGPIHISVYNQTLIMGEGVTGGAFGFTGILPAAPAPALGVVRVLAIPMTYADQNGIPSTEAALYATLRDVGDFYAKASFGRLTLVGVVTPPVKLPHNEAWYIQRDTSNGGDISGTSVEHSHARDEARKLGYDSNEYDCIVVRHGGGPGSYGGLGGGSSVWARNDSPSLWAHEIGHCFALAHSNFWDTAGTSSIGAGANAEYGDSYDIMGGAPFPAGQYNAQAKNQIQWMPSNYVQKVTQSGVYRIYAFDQTSLDPSRRYAMTIVKDSQRTYWGEVRALFDTNPWAKNGMLLGWRFPNGSGSNLQRIDTTPGSLFLKEDAAISLGSTFSDDESGIHITTQEAQTTTSPRYVDVRVNMGDFTANQSPVLTLAASSSVVPVNGTVTFTATASDADGDTLAYCWQNFGDSTFKVVSPNSNVITRTFTTAGTYVVSCTVSDMKGGSSTRNQLITVGNGNSRFTISGRITLLGQGLGNVVITANNANNVVTDSDGYFTVPNLSATTYTLTPLLYGYTFGELFNNSITVGPSATGANFEATATSRVTIAATVPIADELAPVTPGRFTLTRTGDTSQDLVVNVNTAFGSATKGTDYTFTPDYVASGSLGFQNFTIPAGSATLDISVIPVVDALAEGPETVTLELGPASTYTVGSASRATVTINDDDTTLPKVSVTALVESTDENAPLPVPAFTFSRTGSTAAALTVNYTVSGTATAASDYIALSGSVAIPIGAASATVAIESINDTASEQLENIRLQTASHATYITDLTASSASINFIDDDVQEVNIIATDPSATEVNLTTQGAIADPGTFVVTRMGDVTLPLTVYYSVAGTPGTGMPATHGVDYEALPGVLTIPAGQTRASITILPRFDTLGEGAEQVVLQIGAGSSNYIVGTAYLATVTINDHPTDVPYVDVVPVSSTAEGSGAGLFRITARGSVPGNLTVNYTMGGTATNGTDYTTLSGTTTLTIADGTPAVANIQVLPINDALVEPLETVIMTLTPSSTYQTFAPTASASIWLRDDDQPTVFADVQVGTSGSDTVTEGTVTSPTKFYLSRVGSTTADLPVTYSLSGTATNGADYTLNGTTTIPAGQLGVDVPVTIINDTEFEGTETLTLNLTPGSGYAVGPSATMYIADDETSPQKVAFSSPASGASESVTSVSIPVTLTTPATTATSVDYVVDSGTKAAASATGGVGLPLWVRLTRSANSFDFWQSIDGQNWIRSRSTAVTNSISSSAYLAGIAVGNSASGTACTAVVDNVSITGTNGTVGTITQADIGPPSPTGSGSVNSGVYTITSGGPGVAMSGTTDSFRYVYFPLTNSSTCTITARIVSVTGGSATAHAGVMIRETVASNSRHCTMQAEPSVLTRYLYRTTAGSNSSNATSVATVFRPYWVRLEKSGAVLKGYRSTDGQIWSQTGNDQTLGLSDNNLVGLVVTPKSDGQIHNATFDNVTITPPLPAGVSFQGRSVGYLNVQGTDSVSSGTYALSGSGNGINVNSQDECHFVAALVTGDFTITARIVSQSSGAITSQAGVMVRENDGRFARMAYSGLAMNAYGEFITRATSVSTATGSGVDHTLTSGTLQFAVNDQTKSINFNVINDTINEPNENITITLKNSRGAQLGSPVQHTYTIMDNDVALTAPLIGFASAAANIGESAGQIECLVTLSEPATAPTSVNYGVTGGTASAGADYTSVSGTLTFAVGESVKAFTVPITNDAAIESDETIILTLASPVGGQLNSQNTHTITIVDDDKPVVTITANDPIAIESGDTGQFTLSRTGPTTSSLSVGFTLATGTGRATAGTDYANIGTSLTIPSGQSSATITITPLQDVANEGNETIELTLTASANYTIGTPSVATVTLMDDDRSTVSVVANDPTASETPGNPGQFTITRTAPTTEALSVLFTLSGTATDGADYNTITSPVTIPIGQTSVTITVTPINDTLTEGDEQVILSLAAGTYDIGTANFANVTIQDNDSPPTLFISSPGNQGPLVAATNGLKMTATVSDDGAPQPVTLVWSQVSGPGTATFESPTSETSGVTFSAPGTYILRVTATDGQFTVSDQLSIVVGDLIDASEWIAQDMTPTTSRRGLGFKKGNTFTVQGTGGGYASVTGDAAHTMTRQITASGSITARLTSLTDAASPLAGVTIRDSLNRGAKRAVLGFVAGSTLQLRIRSTVAANDALVASQSGITLPVWLKLERNATTNSIVASYARDTAGSPGTWNQLGATNTLAMTDSITQIGLTTTSNSTATTATALFDNVALTPAQTGPALITEDFGTAALSTPSSWNASSGNYTIASSSNNSMDTGGAFYGWQYTGDIMVTAKHVDATSSAGSAKSGIMIRESMDSGGFAHLGRIPTGSYSGFVWRSLASGSTPGVPSFSVKTRWVRLIRKGNAVTAFHAPDVSGNPGIWAQLGQPQTVIMTPSVMVGFAVDNSTGVGLNTVSFSQLSIVPLNKAPVLSIASLPAYPLSPVAMTATVSDDNYPAPVNLTTQWEKRQGTGTVNFAPASLPNTLATLSLAGTYTFRLNASDGSAETYQDATFTGFTSPYQIWQTQNWPAGMADPNAGLMADSDHDGVVNLHEYAFNTDPDTPGGNGIIQDTAAVGGSKYLRLNVTKNPAATDLTYQVQATSDLANPLSWSSDGLVIEQNSSTTLRVRDSIPVGPSNHRFMRVQISR